MPCVLIGLIAACWLFHVGTLNGLFLQRAHVNLQLLCLLTDSIGLLWGLNWWSPVPCGETGLRSGYRQVGGDLLPEGIGLFCSVREVLIHTVACAMC